MTNLSLGENHYLAIDNVEQEEETQGKSPSLSSVSEEDLKTSIQILLDCIADKKHVYLASINENKQKFDAFISPGKSISDGTYSFLSVLRRWNSYTPVLPQRKTHTKGGGYFIHHNGIGIVIDPGYNFIENFLNEGFKLDDIDVVIITHAHNDHTVELESIMSLLFKRNKNNKDNIKKIDIYLNLGTFKKYAAFFDLSHKEYPNYINNIVLMDSHNQYKIPKDNFNSDLSIITNMTRHHEMITTKYALGFILKCGDKYLKFTGDTGWDDDIEEKNINFYETINVPQIDIMIPHIGSIEANEFNFDRTLSLRENRENEVFYDNHLGLLGSICMIKRYKPTIVVVSEFGEELKNIRLDIVNALSESTKTYCITGDIGLNINISDLSVVCSKTGNLTAFDSIEPIQLNDDLWYVSKQSFTTGQFDNDSKRESLIDLNRKTMSEVINS